MFKVYGIQLNREPGDVATLFIIKIHGYEFCVFFVFAFLFSIKVKVEVHTHLYIHIVIA